MADVLGEAIVEILPEITNFGKNLGKQFSGVTDEISKSTKDIDKQFASLSGSLEDSLTEAADEVEKAWREARGALAQSMLDIQAKNEAASNKTAAAWRKTTVSMTKDFIEAGLEAGKSANEIEKEFARAAKVTEKALASLAKDSAKQIESDMKRAAKATEKALKDSAKLAEKDFNDMAKAAKKAADEQEKAHKATADAGKDSGNALTSLMSKVSSLTGLFTKMGSAGASIGGLIPIAAALVSTLQAASGAALILPGAIAAIGLAGATLKLAFTGIGDAISAEGIEDLDEALKNLAPPAQEFVKAVRFMKDELDNVRKGVQAAFFQGLDRQIDQLGQIYLPVVTRGLVNISKELNETAHSFADMLKEAGNVKTIDSLFDSAARATSNLGDALAPITQALLDIADVGAEVFADLTEGAGDAAQGFADFIRELKESGQLREIMEDGIKAFKILGGLLADIGAIVGNIFGPLIDGAGRLNTPLNAVLDTFREFTDSSDFADMMRDIGSIMGDLADAIGTVLGAALRAVMPVLAKVISMIGDHLAKVLPEVVPLLVDFADFFGDLLMAVTPLLEPMFKMIQTILPLFAQLMRDIMAAIDIEKIAELARVIAEELMKGIVEITPNLMKLFDQFGRLIEAVGPTIEVFMEFAIVAIPILIRGLTVLTDFILGFIEWAINPLILAWKLIGVVVREVWESAKEWIIQKIAQILYGIEAIKEIPGKVGQWFGEMRQRAIEKIADLVNDVRAIPGKILSALGDLGSLLWDAGARVIGGFISGLKSRVAEIGAILGGITSSIPMLKGPPVVDSKLLTENGILIMNSLVAGFKQGEAGVRDHLTKLTQDIADQMNTTSTAQAAAASYGNMTTKLGAGGAITQAAIAQAAATQAAIKAQLSVGESDTNVTVVLGNQILNDMVTDVVVERDRRTKRAVTAGGRRTP